MIRPAANPNLYRSSIYTKRKLHGAVVPDKDVQKNMPIAAQSFLRDFFSANTTIDRGWIKNGILAALTTDHRFRLQNPRQTSKERLHTESPPQASSPTRTDPDGNNESDLDGSTPDKVETPLVSDATNSTLSSAPATEELPHRRRRRLRKAETDDDHAIPLDASSKLATAASQLPATASFRRNIATYLSLSKPRLSFLILLTTTSAYSLYPLPEIISFSSDLAPTTLSTSTLTLLFLTTGTFLSSASANTLNMLMEPKYDALMSRTRNRPLVRNLVTANAASLFALSTGTIGLGLLALGTNETVAFLSALNIFLYAGVYTPLKRMSVLNTWAGALVGAIPPLMGWAAAAGQAATPGHDTWRDLLFSPDSLGGWLLAGLLFAWQFPHFNAISHSIRDEYKNAGFKMMSWTNPARAGRVALRYSVAMFPLCFGLYWAGIVNGGFLVISTACNAWMTREAWKFWRKGGAGGSARGLFWASVWQLPLVLVGALVCKTGLWEGFLGNTSPIHDATDSDVFDAISEGDGTAETTPLTKKQPIVANINLAMMGFKRPS